MDFINGPLPRGRGSVPAGFGHHFAGDLWALVGRRKLRIVGVAALVVLVAGFYNVVHGPRYTASMRVLVSPGAGAMSLQAAPEAGQAATLLVPDHGQAARNLAALLNDPGLVARMLPAPPVSRAFPAARRFPIAVRLAGALSGWAGTVGRRARQIAGPVMRQMAERVGLLATPRGEDDVVARISHGFAVAALGDTDVLKLDLTWDDRVFAAGGLASVASGVVRAVSGAGEARADLVRAQAGLREAEREAGGLEATGPATTGEDIAGRKGVIAARISAARVSADQIRVALELARRGLAATDGAYRGGGWVGGGQSAKLAQQFADLLQQKQALANATTPDPEAIGAADGRIARLRAQNWHHVRARYADEAAGQAARLALMQAGIDDDQAKLRALDAQGVDAQVLARLRAAKGARLGAAQARVRQARQRIDGAWQEVGGIRVLSQPLVPGAPDWPAPDWLLRMAAAVGLGAGLLSAAMAERARRTIDYPGDITRRLGIEVMARLSEQPAARAR